MRKTAGFDLSPLVSPAATTTFWKPHHFCRSDRGKEENSTLNSIFLTLSCFFSEPLLPPLLPSFPPLSASMCHVWRDEQVSQEMSTVKGDEVTTAVKVNQEEG